MAQILSKKYYGTLKKYSQQKLSKNESLDRDTRAFKWWLYVA